MDSLDFGAQPLGGRIGGSSSLPLSVAGRGMGDTQGTDPRAAVFYFDADCGFCQWSAEWLRRISSLRARDAGAGDRVSGDRAGDRGSGWVSQRARGRAGSVPPLQIEAARRESAPPDVAPHIERFAVYRAAPVEPSDASYSDDTESGVVLGHKAIGAALRNHAGLKWWRLAGRILCLRGLSPLFRAFYRLVAKNRHRLGPLVGVESCAVH